MMKKNENSRKPRKQPMGRKAKRAMAVYAALVLMMTAGEQRCMRREIRFR